MTKKNIAIFPGSFDPLTLGHYDLICRASKLFNQIIVLIGVNSSKQNLFSPEARKSMIEQSISFSNVRVDFWDGLTVDYLKKNDIKYIVRGIRNTIDFESERSLALMNREVYPKCETIYLQTESKYQHISSSLVREVLKFGKDVSTFVPESVNNYILNNIK